tara:strand:- start:202 stop:315 length:114 start_codon:yes stop_codon:yes gene_type:complete
MELAERLGMTRAELDDRMTADEFADWVALAEIRREEG